MSTHTTLSLLLLAVGFMNSLSGQEVTQIYEGKDTLFVLPSGLNYTQLTSTASLDDYDLPDGVYRQYIFDSEEEEEKKMPIAILEFDLKNKCLNGLFQKTNTEGKILEKGHYLLGKQQGYWYEYGDSLDTPIQKTYFELGATVETIFYSKEGAKQMRMIYFYESPTNKKVLSTWYFDNGFMAMQGVTQIQLDGQDVVNKTGQWRSWFTEGNIRSVVHYKNGALNGICDYFYEDGHLSKKAIYKKGKLKKEVDYPQAEVAAQNQKFADSAVARVESK